MAAMTKAIELTIITGYEGKSTNIDKNAPALPVQNGSIPAVDDSLNEKSGRFFPLLGGVSKDFSTPPPCLAGMKIYAEAQKEFEHIRKAHRTLAPTGCTPEFCQSGRATRINEPRVGRDRPLAEIQQEAVDFLRECRDYNVIPSDFDLDRRIKEALVQISHTAIVTTVTDHDGNKSTGLAGGTWYQEPTELEYGLRAAWRNARRCIMRSEHENLALCDLRQVQSSPEMARTIVKGVTAAFNRGHILPTVFVFPPRQPNKRGPVIWNSQILAFAGYRQKDGSILGDPLNVELTDSVIELGWTPPINKSRWDILPLVTMAEGDAPYMMELPMELKRTVQITHPHYEQQFRQLGLHWVVAPALSRLGFDIGGNQYTASPFIGWFMDAEIGVRNLADPFRYNVLPDVVKALQLTDESDCNFDEMPEYMRMLALSRAQAELNFAVYYSFLHDHITMIDSLSSSALYMEFDKDHMDEMGYRLPADPYWLSPPQGSIVPIWHRGAAPNYQPKPMICRHVQDPVKAWRRETSALPAPAQQGPTGKILDTPEMRPRIRLFTCSAGVNAAKMANKLYDTLQRLLQGTGGPIDVVPSQSLNRLDLSESSPEDIILVIASTTGRGEMPRNAAGFLKRYESAEPLTSPPRFSCFANGDSTYGDTYNAAAKAIQQLMEKLGCRPLLGHCFAGDTAINNPDWDSFNRWVENIDHLIIGSRHRTLPQPSLMDVRRQSAAPAEMPTATLVKIQRLNSKAMMHITLDIGDREYQEMDHIKVLAPNPDCEVERVLSLLQLSPSHLLDWNHQSAWDFLSRYVDLDHPFRELDWYPGFHELPTQKQDYMRTAKVAHALEDLKNTVIFTNELVERICKGMASITPRLYSAASCPQYVKQDAIQEEGSGNMLDIMVKVNPQGRFSENFLLQAQLGAKMRFGLTTPDTFQMIQAQKPNAPLIAIATGSGIGPIRAILQRRIVDIGRTTGDDDSPVSARGVSNNALCLSPTSISPLSQRQPLGGNVDYDRLRSGRLNKESGSPATPSLKRQWSWGRSVQTHRRRPDSISSEAGAPAEKSASRGASIASNGPASRRASISSHLAHLNVPSTRGSVSLFVGFKNEDSDLIQQVIRPACQAAVLDVVELVPSNAEKIRVQDHLLMPDIKEKLSRKLQDPSCIVFICANEMAATAAGANLNSIADTDVKNLLGERYIEEVFRG